MEIKYGECERLERDGDIYALKMDDGDVLQARAVVVATGRVPRRIRLPAGIEKSVSTCATCDGPLYKGKNIVVLGGGNSAVAGAMTLARRAKNITIVSRSPLRADAELAERMGAIKNIEVFEGAKLDGSDETYLRILRGADAVFMFLGAEPATEFLSSEVLDEDGYILAGKNNMTDEPGIFAAGDVRRGAINQVVSAAADGAIAAKGVKDYLAK